MGRAENAAVFEDTMRLCKTDEEIRDAIKKSIEGQKLILETDTFTAPAKDKYAEPAQLKVSKKRTLEAAAGYKDYKVCAHNFASATNPGGGVERGATAQEEALCRCSGLFLCLKDKKIWNGFYQAHRDAQDPLHNDDIIYTPDVPVIKSDTAAPKALAKKDRYFVDVLTCAAPNLRPKPNNAYNSGDGMSAIKISDKQLLEIHEKRLRRMLDVALAEGAEVVVLGAFGCGAFMNNPEVVARAAKNVIPDYCHAFRTIEFAVYCRPDDERNYKVFERILK